MNNATRAAGIVPLQRWIESSREFESKLAFAGGFDKLSFALKEAEYLVVRELARKKALAASGEAWA
ncbi:hypothetical protein [Rhodococcus sp. NPDC058639]|uniref:hypothetical protein n=1 Tax=Rhodococcus sp. NPDC058639 TaxID=3346570 RepID=UPI00366675DF